MAWHRVGNPVDDVEDDEGEGKELAGDLVDVSSLSTACFGIKSLAGRLRIGGFVVRTSKILPKKFNF